MLGKRLNMPIILRGVELQGFAAKFACLPILIERMLQEIFLGDCGIQPGKKFGVGHDYLQPRSERGHSRAANCTKFQVTLLANTVRPNSGRPGKMAALREGYSARVRG